MENFDYKKYLANNPLLKEEMGSYRKFLEVVKSYEDEDILNDFLNTYPEGEDISKSEYEKFTEKHLGLPDPEDWRGENWKYITTESKKPLNETIVKFDDFSFEIHEDFSSTPTFIIPNIEFETDEEGFALDNEINYKKLWGYREEIKAMYTLFGPESGVKDQNGLYLSIDDIIDYL